MARRLSATSLVLTLAGAWLLMLAPAAHAACHIAGFVESEVETSESAGTVSLVVELQGRAGSCAGTVDVATVDGTAVAGEDYEAVTQTLTFEQDDDRVETVEVAILADGEADGGETFTVELSNPTGDITGTGAPATVTITDDGGDAGATEGAGDEPTEAATTTDATDSTDATQDDAGTEGQETGVEDEETGGGNLGIIIAVVVAIVIGVGAFVLLRGRG